MAKAFPDDRYRACLKKGVLEAVQNQRLPIHEYAVTVIEILRTCPVKQRQ